MKQKLKALASLCLALALTLCLTLPAWAAGDGDAGQRITQDATGSITVKDVESGVKVHVYQLMTVNVNYTAHQPQMPVYSWVKPVGDWLKGNANETYQGYISKVEKDYSVTENFKDNGETNAADIAAFYDSLAAAIRGGTAIQNFQPTETKTVEKNQTECTISGLPMGNYLVLIEGGMKIYRPSAVNLVPVWKPGTGDNPGEWVISSPAEVAIKSSEPTIIKKVKDAETYNANDNVPELDYAQVDIGDTVTYILEADVPQFPADAINKGYVISDDLPDGMTLGDVTVYGVKPVSGDGTTETEAPLTLKQDGENTDPAAGPDLTYTLTKSTNENQVQRPTENLGTKTVNFKVEFSNIVDIYKAGYTKVKITYTATANAGIKVVDKHDNTHVNQNTAYLDYNNNPYEKPVDDAEPTWQTAKATATVYTYGLKVDKKSDTQNDDGSDVFLPGAEFTLTKAGENQQPIPFVYTGGLGTTEGTYRVATQAEIGETGKTTTTLTVGDEDSGNKGNLTLSGLDVGTYILTETKAPAGYNLPSHTFSVTITDKQDVASGTQTPNGKPEYDKPNVDGTSTKTDRADGYERTTITNTQGFTLPTTGGMGTVLFTAGGVVLMGAGLVLLVVFLRRRRAK